MTNSEGLLAGCRVLIVEDEALVAFLLEDAVLDAGGELVGPATTLAEALELANRSDNLAAATLDLNLGGSPSTEVAAILEARAVPFILISGYGPGGGAGMPRVPRGVRVIAKPFTSREVVQAIATLTKSAHQ